MKKQTFFRLLALALVALMLMPTLAACRSDEEEQLVVRYLNFKPEIADKYEKLAKLYEQKTGVKVMVETAANNTYEQTLAAKMATKDAPTLFQINGPRGYAAWKDYCADLADTELYRHLTDRTMAVKDGKRVVGIPYVVEGYGIIYNKALTDRYFALEERQKTVNSMEAVTSFATLKTVVEDMQKHTGDLGIDGVFASTSLKAGEDWRWQTHLLNIPLHYELTEGKVDLTDPNALNKIGFTHSDRYRNVFDLYLNNSVTDKKLVGSKTVVDSMSEFALERCVMVQNGNWAWSQIKDVTGNKVKEENLRFLPIYTGADDEETQGLAVGTENYFAINKQASEPQQKAAAEFAYWMFSDPEAKKMVAEELGFIAPFDTFSAEETPNDPLARQVVQWMKKDKVATIPWHFTLMPSARFKEDFGASLLKYAQGSKTWDAVVADMKAGWERESAAIQH